MAYGTVQVGRLTLREDRDTARSVNASDGSVSLKITGQESYPSATGITTAMVDQRSEDILSGFGSMVPVVFTEKTNLNGYYTVADLEVDQSKYVGDGANLAPWSMTLDLVGNDKQIELESRLGGAQTRSNGYSLSTGERWHAPPINAYGYYAGSSIPTLLTRSSADGTVNFYRGVTYGAYPRWKCAVANYGLGRCRILSTGVERSGKLVFTDVTNFEMNNGIVRVKPLAAGGALEISAWTGGAWQVKAYDVLAGGSTVSPWDAVAILQNDYHKTSIRFIKSSTTLGRITCDVTLRRGSRFAELYLQCATSTTLKVARSTTEAATLAANSSYIMATAADGASNKYILASANTYTADVANGAISKASVTSFDVMVAVQINAAGAGDLVADVYNQYLGIPSELITGVNS